MQNTNLSHTTSNAIFAEALHPETQMHIQVHVLLSLFLYLMATDTVQAEALHPAS